MQACIEQLKSQLDALRTEYDASIQVERVCLCVTFRSVPVRYLDVELECWNMKRKFRFGRRITYSVYSYSVWYSVCKNSSKMRSHMRLSMTLAWPLICW